MLVENCFQFSFVHLAPNQNSYLKVLYIIKQKLYNDRENLNNQSTPCEQALGDKYQWLNVLVMSIDYKKDEEFLSK